MSHGEDIQSVDVDAAADAAHAPMKWSDGRPANNQLVPILVVGVFALFAVIAWSIATSTSEPAAQLQDESVDRPGARELGEIAEVGPADDGASRLDSAVTAQSISEPLLAAELFHARPRADTLRQLFQSFEGLEPLTVARAEASFDVIQFDPQNPDRLLASKRVSYGLAENQASNELWLVEDGGITRQLWSPDVAHDFAEFNANGSVTRWVHAGGPGFAARVAEVLDDDLVAVQTAPMYASRSVTANGAIFALTGDDDYYTQDTEHIDLIVDDGETQTVLAPGSPFARVEAPLPGIVIAFPVGANGSTQVWDTNSLQSLPEHPLAGRSYQALGVSGDGSTAVAASHEDELELLDLAANQVSTRFGSSLNFRGVDDPITVSDDGSVTITVERDGRVTIWWTGDPRAIASVNAGSSQPRWISESRGPLTTSVSSKNGVRIALFQPARGEQPTMWQLLEAAPASWVQIACDLAGRALTASEAEALGLTDRQLACGPPTAE